MFSLLGTQTKSVRILQDVRRAWIAVQLGRESKAHSASSPQISDLLLRQGLHCALLQASVRMMSLTESDTRYCGHDKDEENFRHSGPPKRCLPSLALFQAQHHRATPKGNDSPQTQRNEHASEFCENGKDSPIAGLLTKAVGSRCSPFRPFPAHRPHARHPPQHPSRLTQRRPYRPRQDCIAGGDPGVRVDLGGRPQARHVVSACLAAGGADQPRHCRNRRSRLRPVAVRAAGPLLRPAESASLRSIALSKTSHDPRPRRNFVPWGHLVRKRRARARGIAPTR